MVIVDHRLGSRAEFLNAWSVVERLLGRPPSSGASIVASHSGPVGEFFVVIIVNLAIGFILAALVRFLLRAL